MQTRFRGKRTKFIEPRIPEYLRRVRQVCNWYGHQYQNNKTYDKWILQTSIYEQKYPDLVQRELRTILRVKVPKGQFELDEKGTIDENGTVKEALVYGYQIRVMDPANPHTNVLSNCSIKEGYYHRPFFMETRDDLGNVIESTIQSQKNMFWIPFTRENVQKVLEEFEFKYRNLGLAVAQPGFADPFYGRDTYRVYSLEEYLNEDFDDILSANRGGYLRKDQEGQVQKFVKDRFEREEKARAEIAQFKEQQQQRKSVKKTKLSEDNNDTT